MNNNRFMRIKFVPAVTKSTGYTPPRLRAWLNDGRKLTKNLETVTMMTKQAGDFALECADAWELDWPVYGAKYSDSVWVFLCAPDCL